MVKYIFVALIILAYACEYKPSVVFTAPEPASSKDLSKFPRRLQGEYLSLRDSSKLIIGPQIVCRVIEGTDTVGGEDLAKFTVLQDSVQDPETGSKYALRKVGEKYVLDLVLTDTLFRIDEDHLLRKWKSNFFLNTRYDSAYWKIDKLQLAHERLYIHAVSSKEEVLQEYLAEPESKGLPYKVSMSRKEFKKFVKGNGFNSAEVFLLLR